MKTIKLTEEELIKNYEELVKLAETYFSKERMVKVHDLLKFFEDRIILSPASQNIGHHNCYIGGYCNHVLNVIHMALKIKDSLWGDIDFNGTEEELVFSAFFHDFGKLGDKKHEYYIPEDSQWHMTNMGRMYKMNPDIPFMKVPDRALFLLQEFGVKYTINEFYGIRMSDGLFEDANKSYYKNYGDISIFTSLPHIVHMADLMSFRMEQLNNVKPLVKKYKDRKPKIEEIDTSKTKIFENLFTEFVPEESEN